MVDGQNPAPGHQLPVEVGSLSHDLYGFIHPRSVVVWGFLPSRALCQIEMEI